MSWERYVAHLLVTTFCAAALAPAAVGQSNADKRARLGARVAPTAPASEHCEIGSATQDLDVNNVRARLYNIGQLFSRRDAHVVYTVPKDGPANAIFASGLWVGGLTEDGERRFAGTAFEPYEFWPGPLDDAGNPPDDCAAFDRLYKISRDDLEHLEQTGEATADIRNWPWDLGAPVEDGDGNPDNYDLGAGDRPRLFGDQTIWWVMNDAGGEKQWSKTPPIGLEVQVTAYAYQGPDAFANTTFYRYKLSHKGDETLHDAYVALWADPDLGNGSDDYVGSDTLRDMGFVYNGTEFDQGFDGYGDRPPSLGYVLLEGIRAEKDGLDNDADGQTDEAGERLGMTNFLHYIGHTSLLGEPFGDTDDAYDYMQSIWKDDTPLTFSGNGYGGSEPTDIAFPGTPPAFWSMDNLDGMGSRHTPSDMRFVLSMGPITLAPGDEQDFTFAIVWSRTQDRLLSIRALQRDVDFIRASLSDEPYTPPLPPPPVNPALASPPDGASGVVTSPDFSWHPVGDSLYYLLQLATDPSFSSLVFDHLVFDENTVTQRNRMPSLQNTTTYYWRVRAENLSGTGPWSTVRSFTTATSRQPDLGFTAFETVANAAGPIDPPTGGSADFAGFPMPERPGSDQQVDDGIWFITTGESRDGGGYDAFLSNSIGHRFDRIGFDDFEVRFTERCAQSMATGAPGCYGYDRFDIDGDDILQAIPVPFELWNIGTDTPDDPSDDVRLVPAVIDWEGDGFGLRDVDNSISNAENDPESDWFFWYDPTDTSPGTGGYETWEAGLLGSGDPETHGDEIMARMVYVNWNGGNVHEGFYNQKVPEPGTIFRLRTVKPLVLTFEAELSGTNNVPAAQTGAHGHVTLSGTPLAYALEGQFSGLRGDFLSATLYRGHPGLAWSQRPYPREDPLPVTVELTEDRRSGTFRTENNTFSETALPRRFDGESWYLVIRTEAFPEGELRGHLLPAPNDAPEAPPLTSPADGATVAVEGPESTPFTATWDAAIEPNGNRVVYLWQLAAGPSFERLLVSRHVGSATRFETPLRDLATLLEGEGVALGERVTWYHRAVASDGSLVQVGPARAITLERETLTATEAAGMPARFALHGNYPNPFNPTTTLVLDLPAAAAVTVVVYDVLGRRVLTVPGQRVEAGAARQLRVDGSALASGVYFYRVRAEGVAGQTWRRAGRFVLVK